MPIVAAARRASSVLFCLVGSLSLAGPAVGAAQERPWAVEDSIAVRYVDDDAVAPGAGTGAIAPAPDGRHFFFVTRRGDLSCDCVIYEMSIFAVTDLRKALVGKSRDEIQQPVRKVTMRSMSSKFLTGRGIMRARWVDA